MAERGEEIRTWDCANTLVVTGVWLWLDIAVEKKSAVEHRFDRAPGTCDSYLLVTWQSPSSCKRHHNNSSSQSLRMRRKRGILLGLFQQRCNDRGHRSTAGPSRNNSQSGCRRVLPLDSRQRPAHNLPALRYSSFRPRTRPPCRFWPPVGLCLMHRRIRPLSKQ